MARGAMKSRLLRHLAEPDLDIVVAAGLTACLVDGHEAMHLEAVAGRTLDVPQGTRIGLEMDAVSGRRRDALPLFFFLVAQHVASGADASRHFGMHADLLGPIRDPQIQLARTRENRLLMAVVAAERIVLGTRKALERILHDVATGTEAIVVLHVIPADGAEPRGAQHNHRGPGMQRDLDRALPRAHPRHDLRAQPPQVHRNPRGHGEAHEEPADLEPLWEIKKEP